MIAKISNISSFAAIVNYVVGKEKEVMFDGETINTTAAVRIGGWVNAQSIEGIIKEFNMIPNKLKHPGKHLSLSLPIGEKISNDKWLEIAKDVMKAAGYGNNQWVCFKHTDASHEHTHIIINRKDFEGKTVKDFQEKIELMKIMRKMEVKHGLTQFERDAKRIKESTIEARLTKAGRTTIKKELHDKIKKAIELSRVYSDFEDRLKEQGVEWNPRKNEHGAETGARFEYKGKTYSGSKVGYSIFRIDGEFTEKYQKTEHRLQDLKEKKKNYSGDEFAELIIAERNIDMLSRWMRTREINSKARNKVQKLFDAMNRFSNSTDVSFMLKVQKEFDRFNEKYSELETKRKSIKTYPEFVKHILNNRDIEHLENHVSKFTFSEEHQKTAKWLEKEINKGSLEDTNDLMELLKPLEEYDSELQIHKHEQSLKTSSNPTIGQNPNFKERNDKSREMGM